MQVVIEFYRVREADEAHAVIGREIIAASDLHGAMTTAHELWKTLEMPQRPDAVSISDREGKLLYSGRIHMRPTPPDARIGLE
jgi:hypothetical protein